MGDGIVEELRADGVDTGLVLRQAGAPSPFTYIIVDAEGAGYRCRVHIAVRTKHKSAGCMHRPQSSRSRKTRTEWATGDGGHMFLGLTGKTMVLRPNGCLAHADRRLRASTEVVRRRDSDMHPHARPAAASRRDYG